MLGGVDEVMRSLVVAMMGGVDRTTVQWSEQVMKVLIYQLRLSQGYATCCARLPGLELCRLSLNVTPTGSKPISATIETLGHAPQAASPE